MSLQILIVILLWLIGILVILIYNNLTGWRFREDISLIEKAWFLSFFSAMLIFMTLVTIIMIPLLLSTLLGGWLG